MPLPRPRVRTVATTAGVALVLLACKPIMPATFRVPGDEPVLEAACAPHEYAAVPASNCAFLKCDGAAAYAFCDRGRYMYCACDDGELIPPPYHKADLAPRELRPGGTPTSGTDPTSSTPPSSAPRAP